MICEIQMYNLSKITRYTVLPASGFCIQGCLLETGIYLRQTLEEMLYIINYSSLFLVSWHVLGGVIQSPTIDLPAKANSLLYENI